MADGLQPPRPPLLTDKHVCLVTDKNYTNVQCLDKDTARLNRSNFNNAIEAAISARLLSIASISDTKPIQVHLRPWFYIILYIHEVLSSLEFEIILNFYPRSHDELI